MWIPESELFRSVVELSQDELEPKNGRRLLFSSFSDTDTYPLAGSGSTSGNVHPDPSSKKIVINLHKNQPKL